MQNDFSKGAMWSNILKQAVAYTVAQIVQIMYNIVDRIYLGHLPGNSGLVLTGVGLVFPIVAIITAFCSLFSTGGAPLCSMARGAGGLNRAEKVMGNTFLMLVAASVFLLCCLVINFENRFCTCLGQATIPIPMHMHTW